MSKKEIATFAGGCFWCTEAIYQKIKGVESVKSGYTGGELPNPTYDDVCNGKTGHAEAVQIVFDPTLISYEKLLEIFFKSHDYTTLNRQGNDVGTQYRSAVFYANDDQKNKAQNAINALGPSAVTTLEPLKEFYIAEDYHQNFYKRNGSYPYCRIIIEPKIEKLEKTFMADLKK